MRLLERAPALDELERWSGDVRGGHGRVVVVGGEAGVGKTSLLEEFADRHRAASRTLTNRLLWAGCDPSTTPRPLGPLADIGPALGGRVEGLL